MSLSAGATTKIVTCYKLEKNVVHTAKFHGACAKGWSLKKPKPSTVVTDDNGPTITLDFATTSAETNTVSITEIMGNLAADAAKQTNGHLTISMYPSGSLYATDGAALTAAESGQLALYMGVTAAAAVAIPAMSVSSVPFLAPTEADAGVALSPGHPWFTEAASEAATKDLTLLPVPSWNLGVDGIASTSSTPPTLASLSGVSLRSIGGLLDTTFKDLGATPLDLAPTAIVPAMEAGTISGSYGSNVSSVSLLEGVGKSFSSTAGLAVSPYMLIASQKIWNSLPKKYQEIIIDSYTKSVDNYQADYNAVQNQVDQNLVAHGFTLGSFSAASIAAETPKIQSEVWPAAQTLDPASYTALIATLKQLKYPVPSS